MIWVLTPTWVATLMIAKEGIFPSLIFCKFNPRVDILQIINLTFWFVGYIIYTERDKKGFDAMFRAYCVYAHTVTLEKIPVETAIFKDFPTLEEAEKWLEDKEAREKEGRTKGEKEWRECFEYKLFYLIDSGVEQI